jgi:hypothetical protein
LACHSGGYHDENQNLIQREIYLRLVAPLVDAPAFERDGYQVLPGLFTDADVAEISGAFGRLMARHAALIGPDDGSHRLLVTPLTEADPFFAELLGGDRLMDVVDGVLGEDCLYTGLSSAIRWAHTTGWHTDPALPGYPNVKLALYLDPVGPDSGCLTLLPGSHTPARHAELAGRFTKGEFDPSAREQSGYLLLPTRPGDLLLFNRAIWHSTWGPPAPRRQIHFTFWGAPGPVRYGADAWHRMYVAGLAAEQKSWRAGARLFSASFIESVSPRLRRKIQPLLDWGYCDDSRPAFAADHLEFSQT